MKCTFNAVANFWETCKRLVESFFFFFQISVMFYSFAAGIASCITFLFNFGEVYYKMLLYSM